jgi:hypothetical protein
MRAKLDAADAEEAICAVGAAVSVEFDLLVKRVLL